MECHGGHWKCVQSFIYDDRGASLEIKEDEEVYIHRMALI